MRLGNFREEPADDRVRGLGRRPTELLQLLSLQAGRCLPHEQVLEALWPHLDLDAGSANLRKAAHHARHAIGQADALQLRNGQVYLLPSCSVQCDAVEFERAADRALAAEDAKACCAAAQLYGGDLLPESPYEPWTEAPRRRLREKYLRLLRQGCLFERLAEEEPTDEAACAALMQGALASGRRAAALRWYGRLRDHLQSLGIKPGPEVDALYRKCVAGAEGETPGFIGRAEELGRVLAAMNGSSAGACCGVILRAPAGMGKTALCRRLQREAREMGWQVRAVQASDWTRPYGLAKDLIEPLLLEAGDSAREALGRHALAVLTAMNPAGRPAQALALPISRHQVVGAVRRLLLATAPGRPVLLVVDDAHCADDASAEILAHLAASGPPLFVLLGCRPSLPQVLDNNIERMLRADMLEVVELGPLDQEQAALLAARSAPEPLPPRIAADIARLGEGVPFAVVELARTQRATSAALAASLPANASAAITERLCDVEPDILQLVQRLALAGNDFDAATAIALASNGEQDPTDCLDRALDSAVLIVDDGRYRFRHSLVRQALVNNIAPHRRVSMHREIAQRLQHAGSAPGLAGQHWLAAGDVEQALPCSLAAAREAFRLGACQDVLRHVDPLLELCPRHPEALALRAESMDALGRPGTLAAYDAAAEVAPYEICQELKAKRALAQVKMSDPPGALKYLQDVKPTTVPGRLAEALAYSGAAALGFGDPAEGARRAAEVRRLALETGDEGTLVIASWAQAAAAHARGDLHGSVWADLRETSHLPHLAVRVFDGHLCITQRFLYGARPYPEVIAFANSLAAEARRLGATRGEAFAITLRGEARLLSGHLDEAEKDLIAGGQLHRKIGGATGEALSLQRRAELALHRGLLEDARRLLSEALDVARQSDVGFHLLDRIYGTRITLARASNTDLGVLEEAQAAVCGPLETCPGCRITFAIPATIAAARARRADLADAYLRQSEYLANVVMKLPAWHAALHEARAHVALLNGDTEAARENLILAARTYRGAGHVLDETRCNSAWPHW
ncbi:ATP-binding protein [Noviherbaspirillum sp. ST9]|uniref:ATP-binding protein n=1 Tax=Noviherbaspirillum sp. ST9 TaxID=3401606 RepID=UPI003B58A97B